MTFLNFDSTRTKDEIYEDNTLYKSHYSSSLCFDL